MPDNTRMREHLSSFRLHILANIIDEYELVQPFQPTFSFFAGTMEEAEAFLNALDDAVVTIDNDERYPAQIRGSMADFEVTVFIRASAKPVIDFVQTGNLDPRLTRKRGEQLPEGFCASHELYDCPDCLAAEDDEVDERNLCHAHGVDGCQDCYQRDIAEHQAND